MGLISSICNFKNYFALDLACLHVLQIYVAQIGIALDYCSALVIATGVGAGLNPFAFGSALVALNIFAPAIALYLALRRLKQLEAQRAAKLSKQATKVEWAIGFSAEKFESTFNAVESTRIFHTECLCFWYCSLPNAHQALKCGIPTVEDHHGCGIFFSLHRPHQLDGNDRRVFPNCTAVVVCALPRKLLREHPSFGPFLRLLPIEVLCAIRSSFHHEIGHNATAWFQGGVFFPPQGLVRAYQLTEVDAAATSIAQPVLDDSHESMSFADALTPKTCTEFAVAMQAVRKKCEARGWACVYHYTDPQWAPSIARSGFRMSTQGQGDGGVYFSVRGPTSYGLGTDKYEENIIVDCFGESRLHEYRGKHKLDVVFVYGASKEALTQAPGGRDNAFMASKALFEKFSLPAPDGSFLLRPDRIVGIFVLNPSVLLPGYGAAFQFLTLERDRDLATKAAIVEALSTMGANDLAIASLVKSQKQAEHLPCAERNSTAFEEEKYEGRGFIELSDVRPGQKSGSMPPKPHTLQLTSRMLRAVSLVPGYGDTSIQTAVEKRSQEVFFHAQTNALWASRHSSGGKLHTETQI